MCFFIDKKHRKVKIAKKNIVCYKRFDLFRDWVRGYVSPIRGFIYEKNILYYEKSFDTKASNTVDVGLHSYATLEEAKRNKYRNEQIVRCIIPNGSKYYYNSKNKEYVSDHLFIGTEKQYNKHYPYGYSNKLI